MTSLYMFMSPNTVFDILSILSTFGILVACLGEFWYIVTAALLAILILNHKVSRRNLLKQLLEQDIKCKQLQKVLKTTMPGINFSCSYDYVTGQLNLEGSNRFCL